MSIHRKAHLGNALRDLDRRIILDGKSVVLCSRTARKAVAAGCPCRIIDAGHLSVLVIEADGGIVCVRLSKSGQVIDVPCLYIDIGACYPCPARVHPRIRDGSVTLNISDRIATGIVEAVFTL